MGHVEIVTSPYVTESTRVALLLPTFEHRIKESIDFIYHYEKTCMEHQDNTFLMLVMSINSQYSDKTILTQKIRSLAGTTVSIQFE